MKKIFLLSFILLLGSCYKEPDCTETKTCWTITYSFSVCNVESGVYDFQNIRSDTSYSLVNECKVDKYINGAIIGEKRLYDATDDVGRKFIDLYPIQCDCED